MNRQRSSVRSSRGSNSTNGSDPREKLKDCARKFAAFMCTQVGVGALIVLYAVIGAAMFMTIEQKRVNTEKFELETKRNDLAQELWLVVENHNLLNNSAFVTAASELLISYQNNFTEFLRRVGYDYNVEDINQIWTYPASLMFCLSVFSMIGYGNLVPKTQWGKIMTMIYAAFGIPLYVLYFVSMGKVLASTFKWLYTWLHDCSDKDNLNGSEEGSSFQLAKAKKKVIVPSTACLWVISFYIAGGTITFCAWEEWKYYDAVYFVVTSLCKIGFGDFVPGSSKAEGSQGKLVINFIFILFGMGLVAMCYILMREEVREKFREIKEDAKMCMEDISQKFAKCFGTTNRDEEFEERYY